MLWVTERTGKRVTRIDPTTGKRRVAITIDEVSVPGGQHGLLGMALHPELLKGTGNDYVYVAYTYVDKEKGPPSNGYRSREFVSVPLRQDRAPHLQPRGSKAVAPHEYHNGAARWR
jgi:hypothetical protein